MRSVPPSKLLVVLPTLGYRLKFLESTLQSCAALAEHVPTTIALVAPPAAREARALGERYGAELVDDPGVGMAEAVNAGLAARSSESFYTWVGDDDELIAEGVDALVRAVERDPSATVAYGHCDYIDDVGRVIGRSRAGMLAQFLLPWGPNLIPHPGTIIRLDALEQIGGFDPVLSYALDLDVFLKVKKLGRFIVLPRVSARFRWHVDSATVADRSASSREAMMVKNRQLPVWLRSISWLWNYPVAWASHVAASIVAWRARNLAA